MSESAILLSLSTLKRYCTNTVLVLVRCTLYVVPCCTCALQFCTCRNNTASRSYRYIRRPTAGRDDRFCHATQVKVPSKSTCTTTTRLGCQRPTDHHSKEIQRMDVEKIRFKWGHYRICIDFVLLVPVLARRGVQK